jgi:predicted site-specific integrase-resolvase
MSHTVEQAAPVRAPAREFISARDAADRAQVTQATVLRWCLTGVLPARKIVGRWRINPHDLDHLLGDA